MDKPIYEEEESLQCTCFGVQSYEKISGLKRIPMIEPSIGRSTFQRDAQSAEQKHLKDKYLIQKGNKAKKSLKRQKPKTPPCQYSHNMNSQQSLSDHQGTVRQQSNKNYQKIQKISMRNISDHHISILPLNQDCHEAKKPRNYRTNYHSSNYEPLALQINSPYDLSINRQTSNLNRPRQNTNNQGNRKMIDNQNMERKYWKQKYGSFNQGQHTLSQEEKISHIRWNAQKQPTHPIKHSKPGLEEIIQVPMSERTEENKKVEHFHGSKISLSHRVSQYDHQSSNGNNYSSRYNQESIDSRAYPASRDKTPPHMNQERIESFRLYMKQIQSVADENQLEDQISQVVGKGWDHNREDQFFDEDDKKMFREKTLPTMASNIKNSAFGMNDSNYRKF